MSVSRGTFLKALGKSIPGLVLGGGVATAAQKVLGKMAAASGAGNVTAVAAKPESARPAKIDFIENGSREGNRIALTFDDGPLPGVTDRILDGLKRREARATFFMVGQRVAEAPDLARRVLAEGHEVGNHTFTHPKLPTLPDSQAEAEIQKTQDILDEVLHYRTAWFRPPYGELRQDQAGLVAKRGMGIALWDVVSNDWMKPGEAIIIGKILAETKPGSIILCHDIQPQTANAVDSILDGLIERGFAFATLSALMR